MFLDKKHETQAVFESRHKAMKDMMSEICTGPAGVAFLKVLCERSGFVKSNIITNADGDVNYKAMIYNEGRRSMYLDLRPYIPESFIREIEYQ